MPQKRYYSRKHYHFLQSIFLIITFISFFPDESQADAIIPILNLFTPDTLIPASILTILIIVVEALLLRKWIKSISFRLSLWRATIINFASSAVGSLVAWLFFREQMIWAMMGLYIPMFFITLLTETPILKILYNPEITNWDRAVKISFGINIISYLFVFIAQFGFFFAYFGYALFADKQSLKKFNDAQLLDNESGYIYTIDFSSSKPLRLILKRYDVASRSWSIIDPGGKRGIDPLVWDMREHIIACIPDTEDLQNSLLSIFSVRDSDSTLITQIKGRFEDVRIAPDLKKLAVLEYIRKAEAPKDAKSCFMLGSACRLKVYDINSGKKLYEAPDFVLDHGLCWTSDSKCILSSSLRDKNLFNYQSDGYISHSVGRGYAKDGQFPIDLYSFDLERNAVKTIAEGIDPRTVSSTGDITFLKEKGIYKTDVWRLNLKTGKSHLLFGDMHGYHHAISPSGRKLLVQIPRKEPLVGMSFLTVIGTKKDNHRFILHPLSRYDFRWAP